MLSSAVPDYHCLTRVDQVTLELGERLKRPETPTMPQHGITGPHYNLYRAHQNPHNGRCFWQSIGAVPASGLPEDAIPIEPFARLEA